MAFEDRLGFVAFEWDENKRALNLQKHRVDFADAAEALKAPHIAAVSVRRGEERQIAVVRIGERFATVVFVSRQGVCRVISARAARRHERKAYQTAFGRWGKAACSR
jgi:uncharacterized DUF497 family protein